MGLFVLVIVAGILLVPTASHEIVGEVGEKVFMSKNLHDRIWTQSDIELSHIRVIGESADEDFFADHGLVIDKDMTALRTSISESPSIWTDRLVEHFEIMEVSVFAEKLERLSNEMMFNILGARISNIMRDELVDILNKVTNQGLTILSMGKTETGWDLAAFSFVHVKDVPSFEAWLFPSPEGVIGVNIMITSLREIREEIKQV